jgi:hypothetical protein
VSKACRAPVRRKPDFVLAGAPKCGTTSLHAFLRDQPEVFVAAKEPHFFAADLPLRRRLSEAEYLDLFRDAGAARRVGEVSVWYLYSPGAAAAIRDFCGPVDVVAVLRNPVDAMYSLHSQLVLNGDEHLADFAAALAAEPERRRGRGVADGAWLGAACLCYRRVYRYAEQVERYLRTFGDERVHCIVFDDLVADPAAACRGLLDFLRIDGGGRPDAEIGRLNLNKTLRRPWLRSLHRRHERRVRLAARRLLPRGLRRRLGASLARRLKGLYSRVEERPPLSPELRSELCREMAPDVERLGALIGRDLSFWLDSTGSGEAIDPGLTPRATR